MTYRCGSRPEGASRHATYLKYLANPGYGIDQERNPPRNEAPQRMQRVDRECHGRPVREHLNQRPLAQIICNQIARRIGDAGAGKRVGSQRLPIVDLDVAMDLDLERRATLVMERPSVTRDQLRL